MKDCEDLVVTSWKTPRSTKRAVTFVTAALGYDSEHAAIEPVANLAKRSMVHIELCCRGKYNRELLDLLPELVPHVFRPLCEMGMSAEEIKGFLEEGNLKEVVKQAAEEYRANKGKDGAV